MVYLGTTATYTDIRHYFLFRRSQPIMYENPSTKTWLNPFGRHLASMRCEMALAMSWTTRVDPRRANPVHALANRKSPAKTAIRLANSISWATVTWKTSVWSDVSSCWRALEWSRSQQSSLRLISKFLVGISGIVYLTAFLSSTQNKKVVPGIRFGH